MFEIYDSAVKAYIANMQSNDLSRKSTEAYVKTFRYFRESMERHGYADVVPTAVIDFKTDKEDVSIVTLNEYMGKLRQLSDFCKRYGFCNEFVFADAMPSRGKVRNAKIKPYTHILSVEQISTLIHAKAPTHAKKPHTWAREQAEITLLLLSGARNSELRALTPADLDWENGTMYLRVTKGGKPRMVPFTKTSQEKVRTYLNADIRPSEISDDEPLFGTVSRKNGEWHGLADTQLSDLIYQYTKSVLGEEYACRTHAQRHGFASASLESGVAIEAISEALGHSDTATTKIYAQRLNPAKLCSGIGAALEKTFG